MNIENKETCESSAEEQLQMIIDSAAKAVEKLIPIFESMIPIVLECAKRVSEFFLTLYSNKRVVYLAKHSKKKRVRKKNIHRITKDMQRWAKNGREHNST